MSGISSSTQSDYQQALRNAQLENQRLQKKLMEAENTITDLEAKLAGMQKQKTARNEKLETISRKIAIMVELWPEDATTDHTSRPDIDTSSIERFLPENYADGTAAEIYDAIKHDEELKEQFEDGIYGFYKTVKKCSSQQRSNANKALRALSRQIFGYLFNGLDNKEEILDIISSTDSGPKRKESTALQALLRAGNASYADSTPPLWYKNQSSKPEDLFLCPCLPLILRAVLFGPSSLNTDSTIASNVVGYTWQVRGVTPAAIAYSAVIAQFLLSPDIAFKPIGVHSKIVYQGNYQSIKKRFETECSKSQVQTAMEYFNEIVFKGVKFAAQGASLDDDEAISVNFVVNSFDAMDLDTTDAPQPHDRSISAAASDPLTLPPEVNISTSSVSREVQETEHAPKKKGGAKGKGRGQATRPIEVGTAAGTAPEGRVTRSTHKL